MQLAFAKHIVDLIHAASDGILDGQEGQIHLARGELLDDLRERGQAHEMPGQSPAGDVLLGRQLIVGERLALVGHGDVTAFGIDQRGDLAADRVVDDLGKDLARQRPRDAKGIGQGLDPRQNLPLAPGIANHGRVLGLGLGNEPHGFKSARKQSDNLVVGLVELLAKIGDGQCCGICTHEGR